jgi:asparagine synthase (glutamine-hydrolysing)
MAGLLGVIGSGSSTDSARRFSGARDAMLRRRCRLSHLVSAREGTWLLGQFDLFDEPSERPAPEQSNDPRALFHGVLHNEPSLRRQLYPEQPTTATGLIGRLYERYQDRVVEHLHGEFCLAIIDLAQHRVFLASDPIGNYPLYWRADNGGLVFASDLAAVIRAAPSVRHLNLRAVGDYVTLGAVLGDRTLVDGISLLPPGTLLCYNSRTLTVSRSTYVELATFFQNKCLDKSSYLDAVAAEFRSAVDRALTSSRSVGLSLSGGLDSRAILSATAGRAGRLHTYTLGVEGCADEVIADKLAKIAGTMHRFFRLDESYLRDFLPNMARMVSLTDGMYLSHGLTEMLALSFLSDLGVEVLLRGHGGELAKAHLAWPLHTDQHVYRLQSAEQVASYLATRSNYITAGLPLSDLFVPDAARVAGDGSLSAFHELLRGKDLSPPECCSYLYLRELNRRFTVPSLELFRSRVEVRLPFLDAQFLKVLLAAPSEWRDSTEIHQKLTGAGFPALLKIRNSNTGAPANASRAAEFVLDKCNTLLKRLNVRGFRHYHNFDAWMRTMLLQSVELELLSPGAKVQAFVSKSTLTNLIRDTREGAADHSYLLQILLILELWQRENGVEAAL